MKVPVVVIKVPLYDYDEEDRMFPLEGDDLEEALAFIKSHDDVAGFSISSIEVVEEEV
jgi:hypothetical protein